MKHLKLTGIWFLLMLTVATMSSCQAIADIFKAGVWTGIIIVAAVIGLIIFLISRGKK